MIPRKKDNNISIHGPVQIAHATDLYKKGRVYTDEILSPFTSIGNMSKATEAHYIHNFSINPKNLNSWKEVFENGDNLKVISQRDITILKNALNNSATYYDSHSKVGIENELSIYVTLNEDSLLTLPSFSQFVSFKKGVEENDSLDITKLITYLSKYEKDITKIEIYYVDELLNVVDESDKLKDKIEKYDLVKVIKDEAIN